MRSSRPWPKVRRAALFWQQITHFTRVGGMHNNMSLLLPVWKQLRLELAYLAKEFDYTSARAQEGQDVLRKRAIDLEGTLDSLEQGSGGDPGFIQMCHVVAYLLDPRQQEAARAYKPIAGGVEG
mmetsp:Transcript_54027/g.167472  ORF Transcript_54027/g.167472 Transcript_54027/m.167472 type:complete len:124 (+) Transcript_54027:545-916(+)